MDFADRAYVLDEQVGFLLRQASQRHTALFASRFGETTPTQWATLAKLREIGPTSQNQLGRRTAMDIATIKGVVDRLFKRGLIEFKPDESDARLRLIGLTDEGRAFVDAHVAAGHALTAETLAPLSAQEQTTLISLLRKIA